MMLVANGTLVAAFVCEDSTGVPTAPTGTPTGVLYKNGSSTAETVTVTMSTAVGVAVATIPSNAVQGDVFHITVTGTVSGTEYKVSSQPETVFAAAVPADVVKISGDATAADNLEAACDGGTFNVGGGAVVAASVTGSTGSVTGSVGSVTAAVTLPTIPAEWITASGIAASAVTEIQSGLATASGLQSVATSLPSSTADAVMEDVIADHPTPGTVGHGLNQIITTIGTTGAGLTAIPWNAAWDTEVQSECADAIIAYDPPTKAEQDAAFTEIKGAGWASSTDTLEKIRDASGGGGGSTVQINPIAIHTGSPAEAPLLTCHQGEYGNKAYLFYDLDQYGQRSATDFSDYSNLRLGVALPAGTEWIETADITVSSNQLTFPVGSLTGDVGTFEATLWDWEGAGATDQRLVVACCELVVTEAVGADEVVA